MVRLAVGGSTLLYPIEAPGGDIALHEAGTGGAVSVSAGAGDFNCGGVTNGGAAL